MLRRPRIWPLRCRDEVVIHGRDGGRGKGEVSSIHRQNEDSLRLYTLYSEREGWSLRNSYCEGSHGLPRQFPPRQLRSIKKGSLPSFIRFLPLVGQYQQLSMSDPLDSYEDDGQYFLFSTTKLVCLFLSRREPLFLRSVGQSFGPKLQSGNNDL